MFFLLRPLSFFFLPTSCFTFLHLLPGLAHSKPDQLLGLSYCTAAAPAKQQRGCGEQGQPSRASNAWQLRMQRFVPTSGRPSQRCSPLAAWAQSLPKAVSEDLSSVQISPADHSWQHTFVQFLEGKIKFLNKASLP